MSFWSVLSGIASWIANADLLHNSLNIMGLIWFVVLILLASKWFDAEIGNVWPKLIKQRKLFRYFILLLLAFGSIFFMQILIDDLITTPIDLVFGSWILMQPTIGAFTFLKLWYFKYPVYLNMALYTTFFSLFGFWRLFCFTKKSAFWLILLIAFQVFLASQHNFDFRSLTGTAKTIAFWDSYPEFRIISGFFVASVLKKRRK